MATGLFNIGEEIHWVLVPEAPRYSPMFRFFYAVLH
jgi:hypothetical protein